MTKTELRVAAVYERLLNVSDVGPNDDIFSLGSDSVQAVQIAVAIEREFQVGLPIEIMESSGVVRDVSSWIDKWGDDQTSGDALKRSSVSGP